MASDSPLFPAPRSHRWWHKGLNERQEHIFNWIAVVVILLFIAGWVGTIAELRRQHLEEIADAAAAGVPAPPPSSATTRIAGTLLDPGARTTAFIDEAMLKFLDPLRGASGKLRIATRPPGAEIAAGAPGDAKAVLTGKKGESVSPKFAAPEEPGIYKLTVTIDQATRAVQDLSVVTLVPFKEKQRGRIGLYYLGNWPFETGKPRSPTYAPPAGFIEVTQENQNTFVSEHFRLRDFLTKDQYNVWPKYLPLNPKLLDKLELTIAELEKSGIHVTHMQVMSGFRTPAYNHTGGNTAGRANLSRHMYGDASDVFVDNDRNGYTDDVNRDGRVDVRDAQVVAQAVERVERDNPSLVGGIGVYSACCGHGPFTHIDVRGFRARWRGSGNG